MPPIAESPRKVEPSPKKFCAGVLPPPSISLQIAKLSENATIPTRGSARAAGYDLYSAEVINSFLFQPFTSISLRTLKFQLAARDSSKRIFRLKFPLVPTAGLLPGLVCPGNITSILGLGSWTRITEEMLVSPSNLFLSSPQSRVQVSSCSTTLSSSS